MEMDTRNFDYKRPTKEDTHLSVWRQILACISVASCHFPVGAVYAFPVILIPQLSASDAWRAVTVDKLSLTASVVMLMMPVAALITGYMVDKLGRVNTIMLGNVPYIVGWVLIATAEDIHYLIWGRFFTGFALAMGPGPAAVYITEVARLDLRGALICTGPVMTYIGMLVMKVLGASLHWRTIAWLSISYCVFPLLFITLWSPESPVWLESCGRSQDALKSLSYLSGTGGKDGAGQSELMEEGSTESGQQNLSRFAIVKLLRVLIRPNGYKPLLLFAAIFALQQFSGIYIIPVLMAYLFEDVIEPKNPYSSFLATGVVSLVVALLSCLLLFCFGRRPLYIVSGLTMVILMFISGYISKQVAEGDMEKGSIPGMWVLVYMAVGLAELMHNIPWTMTAELYPLEVRGMAQGLTISLQYIVIMCSLRVYYYLVMVLGGAYAIFWLFGSLSLTSVIFISIFLPETHKKHLTDIQEYFLHNTIYILSKDKPRD